MDPNARMISGQPLDRRQFALILGGSAVLLAAGGAYGVVTRSGPVGSPVLTTDFGGLSVVNAGRLARLDAQGRPAAKSLAAAASLMTSDRARAPGVPTGRAPVRHDAVSAADHGHGDGPHPGWPQPANFTWGDVVLLEVAVQNGRSGAVLFAPGQLRLKLMQSGITVTPQDFSTGPGAIAAGATEHVWISYLAPFDALEMELEYTDPEREGTASLALPALTVAQVKS